MGLFKQKVSLLHRIKEAFKPTPLRRRLTEILYKLKVQQRRLENASSHMEQRDKVIHEKCVNAMRSKNNSLAAMYANECAELRKAAKVVLQSELALEQISLRLETVKHFGDLAHVMAPVPSIVQNLKVQLEAVLPDISLELGHINESLEYMVLEIGETTENSIDINASGEEAQHILSEANLVAEQRMKERFPDIPALTAKEAQV